MTQFRTLLALSLCSTALMGCSYISPAPQVAPNSYVQHNFVANKKSLRADMTTPDFINAWGIAIRPKGAGGHFWVTAKDASYEYVGDVQASPDPGLRNLHTDALKIVHLPVGGKDQFATGVAFSASTTSFVITQSLPGKANALPITAPAKFLFASDGGIVSAWTENKHEDGTFDRSDHAIAVIDESASGAQFFGLTTNADDSLLYVADFGKRPAIKTYDGAFQPTALTFDQPFDDNHNGKVDAGEYAPFNVQRLTTPSGDSHLFVTYAKTQPCPKAQVKKGSCKPGAIFAGEEDTSKPGQGRLAEFTEDGKLVAIWPDAGRLSAPWGIAFAPKDFGKFSGHLLVGNFGDGRILAFDPATHQFVDYIRNQSGKPVEIDKLWGILFGNGESLGDANALYFAAGPNDEKDGLFGSLRAAPPAK